MKIAHVILVIIICVTAASSASAIGVGLNMRDIGNETADHRMTLSSSPFLFLFQRLAGMDLTLDTAVAKNSLFNYRVSIECGASDIYHENNFINYTSNVNRFTCANTFGFGLFRSDYLRVWAGPQVTFSYEFKYRDKLISDSFLFNKFGSVVGINVHAHDNITLSFETGFRGGFGIDLSKSKPNTFPDNKIEPIVGFKLIFRSRDSFFPSKV